MRPLALCMFVSGCADPARIPATTSSESNSSAATAAAETGSSTAVTATSSDGANAASSAEASTASFDTSSSSSGDCDVDTDPGSLCTSQQLWTKGDQASTLMRPGAACNDCHAEVGGAPMFAVAGTVYPTLHEPTDCYGAAGEVVVRITGSDGAVIDLPVGSSGNFFASTAAGIVFPIRADVLFEGRARAMCGWQNTGDCNLCHTEEGANGAPGRVRLP